MSANSKKCPHCGHINLKRAIYCFQCGHLLGQDQPSEDESAVTRRSQRIVRALWQPELPDKGRKLPSTALLKDLHLEEPVTCLSCGTLNRTDARFCTNCGTPLIVPDREAHLIARASARTDVGRVRENNEDSIGLWALRGVLLALVADGMGGAVAGEEASRLTVEAVQADFVGEKRGGFELLTLAEELITEKLASAIQAANQAVIERVDEDAALRGMGTTATLAYIHGRRAIIAHVGDSRAYLVDKEQGWINQITSDHSFVEALLVAGHITEEQAIDHPMKNVLYRALGQTPDTTADVYDRYLKDGDRIVLCSDGLTRHVSPDEIARAVLKDDNPEAATQRLIDLANQRGGEDNVSVIVILMQGSVDATSQLGPLSCMLETDETPAAPRDAVAKDRPAPVVTEPSDTEPTLNEGQEERARLLQALGVTGDASEKMNTDASPANVDNISDTEERAATEFFPRGITAESAGERTQESSPQREMSEAFRQDAQEDLDNSTERSRDRDT